MSTFQVKFFDKSTLERMSSDLSAKHHELTETARDLRSEKTQIHNKIKEVSVTLEEIEAELQTRQQQPSIGSTTSAASVSGGVLGTTTLLRDASSSLSPPTDGQPNTPSQESDPNTKFGTSVTMSDTSCVAVAGESSAFEHHHQPVHNNSGQLHEWRHHQAAAAPMSLTIDTNKDHEMNSNRNTNYLEEGNSISSWVRHHQSSTPSSNQVVAEKLDLERTALPFPNVPARLMSSTQQPFPPYPAGEDNNSVSNSQLWGTDDDDQVKPNRRNVIRSPPSIGCVASIDPEVNIMTNNRSVTNSGGHPHRPAVGGMMLPPSPLGEGVRAEREEDSSITANNRSGATASNEAPHPDNSISLSDGVPRILGSIFDVGDCADASAIYRYRYQLPHAWKHFGTHLDPSPPQVSLRYCCTPNPSTSNNKLPNNTTNPPPVACSPLGASIGDESPVLTPITTTTLVPSQNERPDHGCNVHDALQRRFGSEMFSYHPYRIDDTEPHTLAQRIATFTEQHPKAAVTGLYVQMFPTELISVGGRLLDSVIRDASGEDDGIVVDWTIVSSNSVRVSVLTDRPYKICHAMRCRVMADRHGFWFARTYSAFLQLREYCSNLRYVPQRERHYICDGLASIPLIVEYATDVNILSLAHPLSLYEPYDLILGRDPNHRTTFPFERPKNLLNRGGVGGGFITTNSSNAATPVLLCADSMNSTPANHCANSTSSSTPNLAVASSTTTTATCSSPLAHQHNASTPTTPSITSTTFSPTIRPRPPNEIYQHYIKLQGKLGHVLKGRSNTTSNNNPPRGSGRGAGGGAATATATSVTTSPQLHQQK